ncbi:hypothetical protein MA16_Dca000796 [Dendrobium catenatum]|uniref:Uncharacterized protein n=1 Tax=Dendrobium catenatum TaxID=906689 RepID=A0A2I0WUX9_9ASPA|nr:hypothetical protein MA16_Dca000796 [Dendrobium catenatum]
MGSELEGLWFWLGCRRLRRRLAKRELWVIGLSRGKQAKEEAFVHLLTARVGVGSRHAAHGQL